MRRPSVAEAARDLDLHVNVLRKWVREQSADPQQTFLAHQLRDPMYTGVEPFFQHILPDSTSATDVIALSKACTELWFST